MWIALSGNLVTLFIGYEVMTLATWPLVAHKGDAEARRGARTYVVVLLATSIGLLLPGDRVDLGAGRQHRLPARRTAGRPGRDRRADRCCSRSTCSASARRR